MSARLAVLRSYRRGHGFKSRKGLNSFFFRSYFHYCSCSVHHCEVRFHSRSARDGELSHVGTVFRQSHESVQIRLLQTFFRLSEYLKCRLPDLRNIFKFRVCVSTYEFCEASGSGKQRMKATGGFWVFNDNSRKRKKKKKHKQTNKQTGVSVITWDCATHLKTK